MQRSVYKRSLLEKPNPIQSAPPVSHDVEPLIINKNFCPMPPKTENIDVPSHPLNEAEALSKEYQEVISYLHALRSKLYRLGIDPNKITN